MFRGFISIVGSLLLVVVRVSTAQSAGGGANRLSFDVGMGGIHERDASISPLLYKGFGFSMSAGLAHEGQKTRTQLDLSAMSGNVSPNRENSLTAGGSEDLGWLRLSHVRRIRQARGNRLTVFAGAGTDVSLEITNRGFLGGTAKYARFAVDAGPLLQLEYQTASGGAFVYRIGVPVVSGITRTYSTVRFDETPTSNLQWMGPGSYRAIDQRVAYTGTLSAHVGYRWMLTFDMSNLTRDPPVERQREVMSAGLIWWTQRSRP